MTLAQQISIGAIRLYQRTLSPDHGWIRRPTCRFSPTCSEFAIEAISRFGLLRGVGKAARRILRCTPFSAGGFDPIS